MSHLALNLFSNPYPQQTDWIETPWAEWAWSRVSSHLRGLWETRSSSPARFIDRVNERVPEVSALTDDALARAVVEVRYGLRKHGFSDAAVLAQAFAVVAVCCERRLGMLPYHTQMKTAYLMLRGRVVELDTGEGKSLTAAYTAALAALAGQRVHVVTVNDYLAERDASEHDPLFAALGLSSSVVLEKTEHEQRHSLYANDIVYCCNKILVFDYLRDRVTLGDRVQPLRLHFDRWLGAMGKTNLRGLAFAIVDEIDSVLVDEARTPLILSASIANPEAETFYRECIACARGLQAPTDFDWMGLPLRPVLRLQGQQSIEQWMARQGDLTPLWHARRRREQSVIQALVALHSFERDVHYIVKDNKVMIVDENTGRVMPDRSWERGLHQMIEIKEGVQVSDDRETMAKISYQQFFRRYLSLSGMSGTCREIRSELAAVYAQSVVRVEPRLVSKRRLLSRHIFATANEKWDEVVRQTRELIMQGRPVLIGTKTIRASEALSQCLTSNGVFHQVLNAKQDADEAERVAKAASPGMVTIATNMAGRGTDIRLQPVVVQAGGLHVILTEGHDNARVDRQLVGRCARQGDPGSWSAVLSLEDDLVTEAKPWGMALWRRWLGAHAGARPIQFLFLMMYRWVQWQTDRRHSLSRRQMLKADTQNRRAMSFSGQLE